MKVTLYTDGAARGNPDGPGGYGAVLQFIDKNGTLHEKELSAGYVRTTNNRMELMAAIDGWVKHNWVRPKTGPVKNSDLWKRLLVAMNPHKVTFHWVKGHDGHPGNERCDRLATSAADGGDLLVDTGLSN